MAANRDTNKVILTVFGALVLLVAVVATVSVNADKSKQKGRDTSAADTQAAVRRTADKLEVTNTIVKKVGASQYDYWFSVKNRSDKPFNGRVDISIWNTQRENQSILPGIFDDVTIEPGLVANLKVTLDTIPSSQGGPNDAFSYAIGGIKYDSTKPLTTAYSDDSVL